MPPAVAAAKDTTSTPKITAGGARHRHPGQGENEAVPIRSRINTRVCMGAIVPSARYSGHHSRSSTAPPRGNAEGWVHLAGRMPAAAAPAPNCKRADNAAGLTGVTSAPR